MSELKKFTYKTRISSQRFCELLIESKCNFDLDIRNTLQQNTRYDISWNNDPTVISMLDMLEELAKRFEREDEETLKRIYRHLLDGAISFDSLDMSEDGFTLTDDLYIKMNARGKQLTDFENFKALLIDFIENKYPEKKEEFCTKLEYDWTQLFWNSAYENWDKMSLYEKQQKTYPIVDTYFFNILNIITELLFFKDKGGSNIEANAFKGSIEQYCIVYSDLDIFSFLVLSLDHLYKIASGNKKLMNKYFTDIFYDADTLMGPSDKIRIFSDGKNANLFDIAIEKGIAVDTKLKILFFSYLYYSVKYPIGGDIREYLRIIRNYMESFKQKDGIKYSYDIRINRFKTYWQVIKNLASEDPLKNLITFKEKENDFILHEKEKACVPSKYKDTLKIYESFKFLKGDLSKLLPSNLSDLYAFVSAIEEIWKEKDSLISRALIACGFYGLYIKNCNLGETYTFGNNDNWERILLDETSNAKEALYQLLEKYIAKEGTPKEKLNAIIKERIKELEKETDDWSICFLKYPEILDSHTYFSWSLDGNYEIEGLGSTSSSPLLAKHINPFVKYVCEHKPRKSKLPWARYSEVTGSFTSHGVKFTISNQGWILSGCLPNHLLKKYCISSENILSPKAGQDIISIALDLIQDLS